LALRLKHHDPKLHATRAPGGDSDARDVFDALEQARVEALGARSMDGIRANLNDLSEARFGSMQSQGQGLRRKCRWHGGGTAGAAKADR
jgi:cobalamin biosynthesis protein CobT